MDISEHSFLQRIKCLNGYQLKMLAILLMVIDHTGYLLFPQYKILRNIGRLAFPIFTFLIAEGMYYTKNPEKYLLRLGIFAIIAEIPFDLFLKGQMFYFSKQNVFFTLLLGALCIYIHLNVDIVIAKFPLMIAMIYMAEYLQTDYSAGGVIMILAFYFTRGNLLSNTCFLAGINYCFYTGNQNYGTLAMIPIAMYNGEKGRGNKYFFYWFYPVHLLILKGISEFM